MQRVSSAVLVMIWILLYVKSSESFEDVCNLGSCVNMTTGICLHGNIDQNCAVLGGYLNATIYLNTTYNLQELTSPGYPAGYCDSMDILWLIFAPQGKKIEVQFTDFVIESGFDFVEITDYICCDSGTCAAELGSFSGNIDQCITGQDYISSYENDISPNSEYGQYLYDNALAAQLQTPIQSSSNVLTIHFASDESGSARGFFLNYRQID